MQNMEIIREIAHLEAKLNHMYMGGTEATKIRRKIVSESNQGLLPDIGITTPIEHMDFANQRERNQEIYRREKLIDDMVEKIVERESEKLSSDIYHLIVANTPVYLRAAAPELFASIPDIERKKGFSNVFHVYNDKVEELEKVLDILSVELGVDVHDVSRFLTMNLEDKLAELIDDLEHYYVIDAFKLIINNDEIFAIVNDIDADGIDIDTWDNIEMGEFIRQRGIILDALKSSEFKVEPKVSEDMSI